MKKNGLLSKAISAVAGSKAGRATAKATSIAAFAAAAGGCTLTQGPVDYEVDCDDGSGYLAPVDCVLGDSSSYDNYTDTTTIYLHNRPVATASASSCDVYVAGPRDYCYGLGR